MTAFRGVFTPTVTPFTPNEHVDEQLVRRHVNFLIERGVHGLIATGTTGEAALLSEAERRGVIDIHVDEVKGRVPVLAGTACDSTKETVRLSRYAENAGVDGLMIMSSFFSLPNQEEVFEHYRTIAENVKIPIMVYNNIIRTNIDMVPRFICRLVQIDNIEYFKDSSGDSSRILQILELCGEKITVFTGEDAIAFESFVLGAKGWVSTLSNLAPKQCRQLYDIVVEKGDIEKGRDFFRHRILPLCSLIHGEGNWLANLKALMEATGQPVGPPRRPLLPATDQRKKKLKDAVEKLEWID